MGVYLIQGFAVHDFTGFELDNWEALVFKVKTAQDEHLWRSLFSGVIYPDPDHPALYRGQMNDVRGVSSLSQVIIRYRLVRFTKKYVFRDNPTHFRLQPLGRSGHSFWVGEQYGPTDKRGMVACRLTYYDSLTFKPSL